jgi:hypothetical protein
VNLVNQLEVPMPELQLLKLLTSSLRARLARLRSRSGETGSMTLELLALSMILVTIAALVLLIVKSKAQQGASHITLP